MDTNTTVTIRIPIDGAIGDRVITPTVKSAFAFTAEDMVHRDINMDFTDEHFPGFITSWSVEENPRMGNRKELVIVAEMGQA